MSVVQAESHKGEDRFATHAHGDFVGFAVYDGHGGPEVAATLADPTIGMLPKILAADTPLAASNIEDVFWSFDAEVGKEHALREGGGKKGRGLHDGSTVSVLLVDSSTPTQPTLNFAWVGDSTAVCVDMSTGEQVYATANHSACVKSEADRVTFLMDLNAACRKARKKEEKEARKAAEAGEAADGDAEAAPADDGDDKDDKVSEEPYTRDEIVGALRAMGVTASDAEVSLLDRAFRREKLILECIPKGGKYRRQAYVYPRPKEKDENQPVCVATTLDPYSSHHRDLQMTRSICDWTKSAWCLPQPELHTLPLPEPSSHLRVILASDGLWDICSAEMAASIARASPTVGEAADELMAIAKDVYNRERGLELMGDDTTVMVVDINPSGAKFVAPPPSAGGSKDAGPSGGNGCCSVS